MKFEIARESLLKPLQQVIGAVERRQTLPALANVLIRANGEGLQLTATDLEIELRADVAVEVEREGETTVTARKLLDICRNLPTGATIGVGWRAGRRALRPEPVHAGNSAAGRIPGDR